ncbi:hypothetical protein AALO_G00293550 [Alosa alosa]|uniref:Uncharacterized protein n=1 Tax=Alosa alosa TaxID=278164 RepID=A0AAV6FHQ7_9TELE|nr:hypothetical protein AALO_G00293550 [Alosa alosa]
MRCARSIRTRVGKYSFPRTSGSQFSKKVSASSPSTFSGRPIMSILERRERFSRSSFFSTDHAGSNLTVKESMDTHMTWHIISLSEFSSISCCRLHKPRERETRTGFSF